MLVSLNDIRCKTEQEILTMRDLIQIDNLITCVQYMAIGIQRMLSLFCLLKRQFIYCLHVSDLNSVLLNVLRILFLA